MDCVSCGNEIKDKLRKTYCSENCYKVNQIKLANEKWLKDKPKKKPQVWAKFY